MNKSTYILLKSIDNDNVNNFPLSQDSDNNEEKFDLNEIYYLLFTKKRSKLIEVISQLEEDELSFYDKSKLIKVLSISF